MNRKKLIIFPTKKQVEYICEKGLNDNTYIISKNNMDYEKEITVLNEYNVSNLGEEVDVLCCHEESLYWANVFGSKAWQYQFSVSMLELLTKDKFKDYLSKHNILNAKYYKDIVDVRQYPIVTKPVIGFGSIGVKMINNYTDFKQQLCQDKREEMLSRIKPYKDKYFKSIDNSFIYEDYILGEFYRTPFVVYENDIKYVFPIKGNQTTYRQNSDFHWTEFEYGEQERIIALDILILLRKLLSIFGLENGVYVAEFIISNDNEIYLLELSPRQTSERIAKIIQLSTGIDLERLAIDIFFHNAIFTTLCERSIKMQIYRTDIKVQDNNYKQIEYQEEQSVYGDKIITVYSERGQQYD